MTRCPNNFQVK